ncbi:MAG TPA: hypothetical protein VJV04_04655 [Nitrospiraceae bacterium]|nr:hypothetical protein [Nitrospiraceae bacterium]
MRRPYRVALIFVGAVSHILLAISASFAFDALWGTVLSDSAVTTSELHVSLFSFAGETGLQFAAASALDRWGKSVQFGLGYDDMVPTFLNALDGSNAPLGISDRVFMLTTPCDKRFQFTLRITW